MWIVELDTASFAFRAFGATEAEARQALQAGWRKHCRQTGADPDYCNPLEDGNAFKVSPQCCYRDGMFLAKWVAV